MLRHTFCHLPGVGPRTEQALWRDGVRTWADAMAECAGRRIRSTVDWPEQLRESEHHLSEGNPAYFAGKLPRNQVWRLFKDFRDRCAYLDIETTGLGGFNDYVTTIALYDGRQLRTYVHGINLDDFPRDARDYQLFITYNGATFDLPFLERQFHTTFAHAHIDLRYILRSVGLKGGLKGCERLAGIHRPGLEDVDGYAAVLLWYEYRLRRNSNALETLLAYNAEDTLNLERLMVLAYNRKLLETPFADQQRLPEAATLANPYIPDAALVAKVVGAMSWRMAFGR